MTNQETPDSLGSEEYWFPAKTYGWGWGLPCRWQGWMTFFAFLIACCLSLLLVDRSIAGTVLGIVLASLGLVAVAYWKGEPPRWRWGDEK